jgi:hypothetical protein
VEAAASSDSAAGAQAPAMKRVAPMDRSVRPDHDDRTRNVVRRDIETPFVR